MAPMKPISRCLIMVAILVASLGVLFATTSPVKAVTGKLFAFTPVGTSLPITTEGGGTGPISATEVRLNNSTFCQPILLLHVRMATGPGPTYQVRSSTQRKGFGYMNC